MSNPLPTGPTQSFANVGINVKTPNFTFTEDGIVVLTFHPANPDDAGTATLYDTSDNALVALSADGYETFQLPVGGGTYYFKCTNGANLVAMTIPTGWR